MKPMEFLEWLVQWGGEILLGLAAAGIIAYLKGESNKLKEKLQGYEQMINAKEAKKTE
jgi:hypothetical protein